MTVGVELKYRHQIARFYYYLYLTVDGAIPMRFTPCGYGDEGESATKLVCTVCIVRVSQACEVFKNKQARYLLIIDAMATPMRQSRRRSSDIPRESISDAPSGVPTASSRVRNRILLFFLP